MPINLDEEVGPIDPSDPKYRLMLANLQGNILKSHGRDFTVNIFLRFTGTPTAVRKWIANLTNRFVTSALRQLQETQEYKLNKISGRAFVNLYLTAAGYKKLGFDPTKFVEDNPSSQTFFRDGMEAGRETLKDPPAKTWEAGYAGRKIHAMILLADEDPARLKDIQRRVEATLKGVAEVLVREPGEALRDADNKPIEHFGYRDGISQPLYFKADVQEESEKFKGTDQWDPSAPLDIVLVKDPLTKEPDCFGSYFVFRKLEQNVKGFKDAEKKLAKALDASSPDVELAGAFAVGRFENGIPVLLAPDDTDASLKDFNNFNYQSDMGGTKCPFQAHIRKTNPRGDTGMDGGQVNEGERRRRITRRGITFGKRKMGKNKDGRPAAMDQPTRGVGLLFQCFQSSIPNQFGFMQELWANNPDFIFPGVNPNPPTGVDPVVGQGAQADPTNPTLTWPTSWGGAARAGFDFVNFVTMKGGEYFFAPSIPFLRSCAAELPAVAGDQAEFVAEGAVPKPTSKKKPS